jgi:F420-non-reducing hydrogenase small subunit
VTTKVRVAIRNLSYCGGCEVALADLGQGLLDLLDRKIELTYAPLFMSATDHGRVDILLVTGAARNAEDIEQIKRGREQARYVVAFGSCSAFGGPPGLANLWEKDELLGTAFQQVPSLRGDSAAPEVEVPTLTDEIKPVDAYAKVDYVLAGCPPPPSVIAEFLTTLLKKIRVEPIEEQEHLDR